MSLLRYSLFLFLVHTTAYATSYEIIPLNQASEVALKNSPLKSYVVSADHSQQQFHKKTYKAFNKISQILDLKSASSSIDPLDFVYDSRFLTESTFVSKYSVFPKLKLIKARQIAAEVYSK